MSSRGVLILAAVLTAFTLVVVGAVAGGFRSAPVAQEPRTTEAPAISGAPVPAELVAQREAEWRKLVDEANARIAAQQQAISQLRLLDAKQLPPVPEAAAVVVARSVSPGANTVRRPELVSFQGQNAWEVALDTGVVYVDAATALVLHDGTAKPGPGLRRDRGESHERHERKAFAHREHDDDEDDDD